MKKFAKVLLAGLVLFASAVNVFALDAKVISVTGKVEVQRNGSWVPVKAGDVLRKGAVISTAFKSSAELEINDTKVSVGPLTRMTVEQLASNSAKDETKLYLDSGSVTADVKKSGGKRVDFSVSSPVATASVRGTRFRTNAAGLVATYFGLVSKTAGRPFARIVEGDEPSGFLSADGKSGATTSTTDVSGEFGIPVGENQVSTTDAVTGQSSTPQQSFESDSKSTGGAGQGLASSEGVSSSGTSAGGTTGGSSTKTGSVVVNVIFED